jgi:hypothetical protein
MQLYCCRLASEYFRYCKWCFLVCGVLVYWIRRHDWKIMYIWNICGKNKWVSKSYSRNNSVSMNIESNWVITMSVYASRCLWCHIFCGTNSFLTVNSNIILLGLMFVPCIIRRSRNNQHCALICTAPLFYTLAPTCFGSSLPSSGNFLDPSELREIQIDWVVYHIMCSYVACVPNTHVT